MGNKCNCSCSNDNIQLDNTNNEIQYGNSKIEKKRIEKVKAYPQSSLDNTSINSQDNPQMLLAKQDSYTRINPRLLEQTSLAVINEQHSEFTDIKEQADKPENMKHNRNKSNQSSFCSGVILAKNNNNCHQSNDNDSLLKRNVFVNEMINENWRLMGIESFVPEMKLVSTDPKEIMYKGCLNKLVISHLYKNCLTNVVKFCLLTKKQFNVYNSKENCLLMKTPQNHIPLKEIKYCKRIDFSCLNILKLQGLFFLYIEIKQKDNDNNNNNSKSNNKGKMKEENGKDLEGDELIKEIIRKEKEGRFFVFFSASEDVADQWVCMINFFYNQLNKQ